MIEQIMTWAAAQAIAKIALDKFVESGAGELGKSLAGASAEKVKQKVQQLGNAVWNRIKGNAAVVEVLPKVAEGQPEEVQKMKNYLFALWKDENSEFAQEVKKLADEIHFELTQIEDNSSMTQNNYNKATGYQVKVSGGSPQIGKINNNYGTQPKD